MPSQPDHQHHVRRVFLPSGKAIEVVYFDDVPLVEDERATSALHVCPACASDLVHPVSWEENGADRWDVTLRCPNCEHEQAGTFFQDAVDRLDEQLDLGTEALVRDLKRLVLANMEDDVARFTAALGAGLIVPEDF